MVLDTIISSVVDLITDPIKEDVVMPIKRHVSYPFNCDRNLKRLCDDAEQLQNKRIRLQHSVDEATRNGEEIFPNVTNWLSTTEEDIQEVKLIQGEEEEAKKKFFGGFCPNLKTRYQLSKKADEKASAIDEQLQNAERLHPISFRPRLQPIVERGEALQSRVQILDQVVDALQDPNLNPILVYGMGGIGKTTLAKEVLAQAKDRNLFDEVVFVAVSETPNLRRIQGDLADALGLTLHKEGDRGRAMELHNRLNNNRKKILIIFDDVWQELDLYAIGILSKDDSEGCKIFLTSRKKDVLCSEMCTKKEVPLGLLEEEEAWRLFEKIVSTEFLADKIEFHDVAKKVVNKCGGLPLLIQKVATDLRKNKNLYAWKNMLKQLEDVEGTEIKVKVHKVIESSYKNLNDKEAKSVFLLCPLFGNSNIDIEDLLIYCMGLGLFKNMNSIEESRDKVLTLIDILKKDSLLLEGEKVGFVKIHDVVREIAAAITSKEHCARVGKGRIKSTDLEREDFRRISLPYCEIFELPKVLQCPEAEVFSVFSKYLELGIPDSFFEGATKLKVLHLSSVHFVSGLPSSLGFLTGLQTLSLAGCHGLNNVAIVAQLKQLEVLSFAGSNVEELPREIEALTELKLLDLRGCYCLKIIASEVLSNLHSLEELYVLNKYDDGYDGWGT